MKKGHRLGDRLNHVSDIAEPMLGVDRLKGEHAYVRSGRNSNMFITKDPADSLYHASNSPWRGHDRYAWIAGPDGIRRGWLTDTAKAEAAKLVEESCDPNQVVF